MKNFHHYFLCAIVFFAIHQQIFSKPYPLINKLNTIVNSNFIQVDIESDNLISKGNIYNRADALELRKNLEDQLQNNPNSIILSLALVKFNTGAAAVNGGFMGLAIRYATNIFRQNEYIGCLAFEYVYHSYGDLLNAEVWYKNSLRSNLVSGMEWREVAINLNPPLGASVVGNFSNGKKWPMYQNTWSTYVRKIMVPKCENNCNYNVITSFFNQEKVVPGKLMIQNW